MSLDAWPSAGGRDQSSNDTADDPEDELLDLEPSPLRRELSRRLHEIAQLRSDNGLEVGGRDPTELDKDEENLPFNEVLERLRCERLKSASLESLFSAFQAECEQEVSRVRRSVAQMRAEVATMKQSPPLDAGADQGRPAVQVAVSSQAGALAGASSAAELSVVPVVAQGVALRDELAKTAAAARQAVDDAIAATALEYMRAIARIEASGVRVLNCHKRVHRVERALAASFEGEGSHVDGDSAPPGARATRTEMGDHISRLELQLQEMRAELASERERSGTLESLCGELIAGAKANYGAQGASPRGGNGAQHKPVVAHKYK